MVKVYKETERKYYKYQYSTFSQPALTGNGTLGGNSFACDCSETASGYYPYYAFDDDTSTAWYRSSGGTTAYVIFYNPNALNISNINFTTYNWSSSSQTITDTITLYGSNDGSNWTELLSDYTYTYNKNAQSTKSIPVTMSGYYKYFKYENTSIAAFSGYYPWGCTEMAITAQQRAVIEGTSSDYDFYVDEDVYKVPVINSKYYAINQ